METINRFKLPTTSDTRNTRQAYGITMYKKFKEKRLNFKNESKQDTTKITRQIFFKELNITCRNEKM